MTQWLSCPMFRAAGLWEKKGKERVPILIWRELPERKFKLRFCCQHLFLKQYWALEQAVQRFPARPRISSTAKDLKHVLQLFDKEIPNIKYAYEVKTPDDKSLAQSCLYFSRGTYKATQNYNIGVMWKRIWTTTDTVCGKRPPPLPFPAMRHWCSMAPFEWQFHSYKTAVLLMMTFSLSRVELLWIKLLADLLLCLRLSCPSPSQAPGKSVFLDKMKHIQCPDPEGCFCSKQHKLLTSFSSPWISPTITFMLMKSSTLWVTCNGPWITFLLLNLISPRLFSSSWGQSW